MGTGGGGTKEATLAVLAYDSGCRCALVVLSTPIQLLSVWWMCVQFV